MIIYGWSLEVFKCPCKIEAHVVDVQSIAKTLPNSYELVLTSAVGVFNGRWFATFSAAQQAAIDELTTAINVLQVNIRNIRKQRKGDLK